MNIIFSPIRSDMEAPVMSVQGDVLTILNTVLDFSGVVPNGAVLPTAGIGHDYIERATREADGTLTLTVLLPHGKNPTAAQAFPASVTVTSGPVSVPEGPPDEGVNP